MQTNGRIVVWVFIMLLCLWLLGGMSVVHAMDVITFWSIHGQARADAWQTLVDEFNNSRSDIRINLEFPASGVEGVNQLLVAIAAGTPPDLIYLDRGHIDRQKVLGIFEPLDSYLDRAGWDVESEWFDRTIERLYMDGKLYGIAVDAFPLTYLLWNKRLFEEAGLDGERPPATYAQLDEIAWQLTKAPSDTGGAVQVGFDPWLSSGMTYYSIWMLLWDTWMWDPQRERVSLTHPRSLELAEWHVAHAQRLQGIRPASWQGNPFASEQLVMRVAETSSITNFEQAELDFEWGMSSMPLLPWQERSNLYVAGEGLAMLAGSRRKDRAWEVMEWLLAEEQGVRFAQQTGIPPARISTLQTYALQMESERERRMLDLILQSQLVAFPSWPLEDGIINSEMFPAIRNLQKDPFSALTETEQVVQGIYDEYIKLHGPWW